MASVRDALLNLRVLPENLCALVPETVPSRLQVAVFGGCSGPSSVIPEPALVRDGLRAWPNPARGATSVQFDLARGALVQVLVYDVSGRRVRRLVWGALAAGRHDVPWDGRDDGGGAVASGVYLIRIVASGSVTTQRLTSLR